MRNSDVIATEMDVVGRVERRCHSRDLEVVATGSNAEGARLLGGQMQKETKFE